MGINNSLLHFNGLGNLSDFISDMVTLLPNLIPLIIVGIIIAVVWAFASYMKGVLKIR